MSSETREAGTSWSRPVDASAAPDRPDSYRPLPYDAFKRAIDMTLALAVLIVGSPLWALTALLVKMSSPGPVLYAGSVMGKNGISFTYYKFRSMRVGSDSFDHERFIEGYVVDNQPYAVVHGKPVYRMIDDRRVTLLGRMLRKLSIDEVPQFYNVLRGDMSIVGPRPPLPYEYELYDNWSRQRLAVRPGITGLAQVCSRGGLPFREMVRLDLEYVSRRSFWLDLKIMLLTLPAMLRGA